MNARRAHGFTLIELLVTLAILGVLGTLVVPVTRVTLQRRHEQELRSALHDIRQGIDDYKRACEQGRTAKPAAGNCYPATLELLVEGVPDARHPKQAKLFFLRRLPRDPFNAEPALSAGQTWVKRSYASEADQPREGADVYDVYSGSGALGLNDVPYSKW